MSWAEIRMAVALLIPFSWLLYTSVQFISGHQPWGRAAILALVPALGFVAPALGFVALFALCAAITRRNGIFLCSLFAFNMISVSRSSDVAKPLDRVVQDQLIMLLVCTLMMAVLAPLIRWVSRWKKSDPFGSPLADLELDSRQPEVRYVCCIWCELAGGLQSAFGFGRR
jgi:hypothetical protein